MILDAGLPPALLATARLAAQAVPQRAQDGRDGRCASDVLLDGRDTPSDNLMAVGETAQRVFIGEDGYEGLTAVVVETSDSAGGTEWTYQGFILDGASPPLPEPYSAE